MRKSATEVKCPFQLGDSNFLEDTMGYIFLQAFSYVRFLKDAKMKQRKLKLEIMILVLHNA